jgi:hypothetical protein
MLTSDGAQSMRVRPVHLSCPEGNYRQIGRYHYCLTGESFSFPVGGTARQDTFPQNDSLFTASAR